jgi:hypothetical protein
MVNSSESLINVVNREKPKMLSGLTKRYVDRSGNSLLSSTQMKCHRRTGETYVIHWYMSGTWKVRSSPDGES